MQSTGWIRAMEGLCLACSRFCSPTWPRHYLAHGASCHPQVYSGAGVALRLDSISQQSWWWQLLPAAADAGPASAETSWDPHLQALNSVLSTQQ